MTLEEINNEEKIVLRFTANWCSPCKALAPIFEEVAKENPEVKTFVVDVDQLGEIARYFNIRGIPTILKLEKGNKILQISGAQPKPEIEKFFK